MNSGESGFDETNQYDAEFAQRISAQPAASAQLMRAEKTRDEEDVRPLIRSGDVKTWRWRVPRS